METGNFVRTRPLDDPNQNRFVQLPPSQGRARIEVRVDYAGFVDPRSVSVTGTTDLALAKDLEHWARQTRFYPGVAEGCAIDWPEPVVVIMGVGGSGGFAP
jgi:hypothetical protein